MAMVVKNNMSAVSTLNTLNKNSSALQKSLAKVSSGMKINSAQDDASGYAISEKMRVQIRSLDQANQNTQNASSMMKTAEGAVSSTVEILKSLKEKAINAATDTNTDSDRKTIQKELDQFIDQIDDNALTTFNGKYLVDGSKQQWGSATYTKMTNQSLASDTAGATALTALKNRNGESLEIESTDYVTASFVKNGETFTTKFSVGSNTLNDIFANLNTTGGGSVFGDGDATVAAPTIGGTSATTGTTDTGTTPTTATPSTEYSTLKTAAESFVSNVISTGTTGNWGPASGFDTAAAVTALISSAGSDSTLSSSTTKATAATASSAAAALNGAIENTNTSVAMNSSVLESNFNGDTSNGTVDWSSLLTTFNNAVTTFNDAIDALQPSTSTGTATTGSTSNYVAADSKIGTNSAGDTVYTADGTKGLTISSAGTGIQNMVSGVTISISDSEGNVKKSANAALDDFNTTIFAKNKSDRNELTFQVGANANQSITVGLDDMRSEALGLKSSNGDKVSVATQDNANAAIKVFDNAIAKALDQQTTIGAVEARLEYTSSNLTTMSENTQAAESTIRDADMAKEMTNYTKNNVLLQAAQSMLAQANQSSSAVLSLLQ